jgi:hypothetical protein
MEGARQQLDGSPGACARKARRALRQSLAMLALVLPLGCAEGPGGPGSASPDAGMWSVRIMKIGDELTARAVDRGPNGIEVQLQRLDGQAVFETTAQAVPGGHVRWSETYRVGLERQSDELPISSSLLLSNESTDAITLEGAIWTTAFVHAQLAAATRGDKAVGAQSGCDIPGIGDDVSCSNEGGCCDAHDECYRANQCTRASWNEEHDSPCQMLCNDTVKSCLLRSESAPGQSVCCAEGSCGDPSTTTSSSDGGVASASRAARASGDAGVGRDRAPSRDAGVSKATDASVRSAAGATGVGATRLDASVNTVSSVDSGVPELSTALVPPPSSVYPVAIPSVVPTIGDDSVSSPDPQANDDVGAGDREPDTELDPELDPIAEDAEDEGDDSYGGDVYDEDDDDGAADEPY